MTSDLTESRQKHPLTHGAERHVAEDDDDEEHAAQHIRAAPVTKKKRVRKTEGRSSSCIIPQEHQTGDTALR